MRTALRPSGSVVPSFLAASIAGPCAGRSRHHALPSAFAASEPVTSASAARAEASVIALPASAPRRTQTHAALEKRRCPEKCLAVMTLAPDKPLQGEAGIVNPSPRGAARHAGRVNER